jgi:hypothetical protein
MVMLLSISLTQARADGSALDSLLNGFKTLPDAKEGIFIDFAQHGKVYNTLGIEIANLGHFGPRWKNITGDLNWVGIDGLVGSVDVNLGLFSVNSLPISKYLQYAYIGYGVGARTLTASGDGGNPKSDNKLMQGINIYIKMKI